MDGPAPRFILDVKRDVREIRIKLTGGLLRLKLVDADRSIYLFNDGYWGGYIMPVQRIHELPIIVEDCSEDGVRLISFDQGPYDKQP